MLQESFLSLLTVGGMAVWVLVGGFWVVTLKNLFRAALSLGIVLVGVAGLFLVLEAEFLAFVQILVYVGAILTLVIFAIMLTAKNKTPAAEPMSRASFPAAFVSLALFFVLAWATQSWVIAQPKAAQAVTLSQLGQQLITTLVLPFEIISLVFVAAMVGAIALATMHPPKAHSTEDASTR